MNGTYIIFNEEIQRPETIEVDDEEILEDYGNN